MASDDPPGLMKTIDEHMPVVCRPGRPPRPAREPRCASSGSPGSSSRPAGGSKSHWPTGCRYCRISRMRSCSSSAMTATAPGCNWTSRVATDVPKSTSSLTTAHTCPAKRRLPMPDGQRLAAVDHPAEPELVRRDASAHPWASASRCRSGGHQGGGDESGEQRVRPRGAGPELRVRLRADVVRVRRRRAARRTPRAGRPATCPRIAGRPPRAAPGRRWPPRSDDGAARRRRARRRPSATCEPSASLAGYRPSRIVPPMSRSPDTTSRWSAIVATTGCGVDSSNSSELAPSSPTTVRAYSMTMHCRPRHRPRVGMPVLAGVSQGAELALDPPHAEAARHADAVEVAELASRALGRGAVVARYPSDVDAAVVVESAGADAPRSPRGTRRAGRCTCPRARPSPRCAGWCTRRSSSSHSVQSTSRNGRPSRRTT